MRSRRRRGSWNGSDPVITSYSIHYTKLYDFAGRQGFATEEKRKLCRYIENMTSVATLVEALHGAGSPQAQRIVMLRQADLPKKAEMAKKVIGISEK